MVVDQIFTLAKNEKEAEQVSQFEKAFAIYLGDTWWDLTELEKRRYLKQLKEYFD